MARRKKKTLTTVKSGLTGDTFYCVQRHFAKQAPYEIYFYTDARRIHKIIGITTFEAAEEILLRLGLIA